MLEMQFHCFVDAANRNGGICTEMVGVLKNSSRENYEKVKEKANFIEILILNFFLSQM